MRRLWLYSSQVEVKQKDHYEGDVSWSKAAFCMTDRRQRAWSETHTPKLASSDLYPPARPNVLNIPKPPNSTTNEEI